MRQQPITEDTWTDAQAMQLVGSLRGAEHAVTGHTRAVLARAFQDVVVPRLLSAQRRQPGPCEVAAAPIQTPDQVAALSALLVRGADSESSAYVQALRDGGACPESIYLDVITPTARHLGRMWEEDECSFADVTLGVMRLANMLRLLSGAFAGDTTPLCGAPHILLAQMPGEQHGLGLAIVTQFFRRAAWNVHTAPKAASGDLTALARQRWFNVVGLSVAGSDRMDALATQIRAIRRASRNPHLSVLVGGPIFVAHPELAAMVGADATAADGKQAVQQAQNLVGRLAREQ